MAKEYSKDEILAVLWEGYDDENDPTRVGRESTRTAVNQWLARGDGVAVYENQDLGHSHLGQKISVSYGSKAAQLEDIQSVDDLPTTLPDGLAQRITGGINWRYQLVGTYRGETL